MSPASWPSLNGIPLAIELAAAALGDRPLSGVLAGLADRFSLLTHGRRTAPPRHQTLRAALEWSLDLLGSDERRLFARLAAFARGGTTEAIAEVCGGLPDTAGDVAPMLRHLARASLIVPAPRAAGTLVHARVGPRAGGHRAGGGRRG